ncbi:hypothetical protein QAD02_005550 [Eretmocerus hayati]|uniref:Uncharacterized protein n=1 Tax=Eretmocerus hayati TaxID=131215 RepID=A0ACC2NSU4_9HYME|nr:hypothetical protein QAD02_005550 [Eretmocerus hayati]
MCARCIRKAQGNARILYRCMVHGCMHKHLQRKNRRKRRMRKRGLIQAATEKRTTSEEGKGKAGAADIRRRRRPSDAAQVNTVEAHPDPQVRPVVWCLQSENSEIGLPQPLDRYHQKETHSSFNFVDHPP